MRPELVAALAPAGHAPGLTWQWQSSGFWCVGLAAEAEVEGIAADCRTAKLGCVDCKKKLAAGINAHLAPFRAKRAELAKDPDYVWGVLADGARRANVIADKTMEEVRAAVGLP